MSETTILLSKKVADKFKNNFIKVNYRPDESTSSCTVLVYKTGFNFQKVNRVDNVLNYDTENLADFILNSVTPVKGFKIKVNNKKSESLKSSGKLSFSASSYSSLSIVLNDQVKCAGIKEYDNSIAMLQGGRIDTIILTAKEDKTFIKSRIEAGGYDSIIKAIKDSSGTGNSTNKPETDYSILIESAFIAEAAQSLNAEDLKNVINTISENDKALILKSQEFVNARESKRKDYERKLNKLSDFIVDQTSKLAYSYKKSGHNLTSSHLNKISKIAEISMQFAEVEQYYKEITGNLTFYNQLRNNTVSKLKKLNLGPSPSGVGNGIDFVISNLYFGNFEYMSNDYISGLI